MADGRPRLRELVETGIALSSELSLDSLLQRLVEAAAQLTDARYAALGVIDPAGRGLERFITTGIDEETRAAIGDLPRGRGILGVLISEATPLRLHHIADDPRSVGFPPNHPPMGTFLGVPVLLRGTAYGNLYLTEKEGGADFTDEDEELVTMLASQAAVAIENARLYESTNRWSQQLQALLEVGNALAEEVDLPRLLDLIASRLRELVRARLVVVWLPGDGGLEARAVAGAEAHDVIGLRVGVADSKAGLVFREGRSSRVDSALDDPEMDHEVARRLGLRAVLFIPLLTGGRTLGVLSVIDKQAGDPRFSDDDLRLAEIFAYRAAVALDLSTRVARDALRRVVEGQELERRRLARELHDETGQALTSIILGLKSLETARGEEEVRSAVAELRELVVATLEDVRRLAVELRPKALDDFGLEAALQRLTESFAEQTGIAVDLESRLPRRLPSDLETVLYRIVQEALTNVVKHARAERVSVVLQSRDGRVTAVIEDDGRGFEPDQVREEGLGLLGMRERLSLVDGTLLVESRRGAGTTLVAEVPLG
ncbi:MAG TPA: GAF domain-containing sensor histidine kinase [Gaiellaceae bacterium]|nr:GAF domain-containing sensor histidine kinase [Gaiellaceae bacterium]